MVYKEKIIETDKLSAIIVEDEAKAQRILKALIEENCRDVEVKDCVADIPSAVKSIIANKPDVVFLDIELPGFSGFELIDFFDKPEFRIIFTTAYSEYALKAFELSAIDYLLKPVQIDKLQLAVEKAKKEKELQTIEKISALKSNLQKQGSQKVALPVAEGFMFVELNEIIYFEADNVYTTIYLTNGNKFLVSKPLKDFVNLIDSQEFYKPHRSYYINIQHIRQYIKQDGGHIIMSNGDVIYIARERKQDFMDMLKANGIM